MLLTWKTATQRCLRCASTPDCSRLLDTAIFGCGACHCRREAYCSRPSVIMPQAGLILPDQISNWLTQVSHVVGLAPLSLLRPHSNSVTHTINRGQRLGFNHQYAGSTKHAPPLPSTAFAYKTKSLLPGWQVDHVCKQIGQGRQSYDKAVMAILSWKQMELGWNTTQAESPKRGSLVCVLPHVAGIWMRLPLQVVFIDEGRCKTGRRLQVGHSTLHGHALAGEERFAVEWNKQDDSVWYELYTVSKPATPVALLSYPIIRLLQKRFQRDTFVAMTRAAI